MLIWKRYFGLVSRTGFNVEGNFAGSIPRCIRLGSTLPEAESDDPRQHVSQPRNSAFRFAENPLGLGFPVFQIGLL
jgi:hypothetical protein